MNILYINHYAGHPEYGMEFRPFYMAEEWHKNGHQSLILGADFSHLRKKNPENPGIEKKGNVNYYWIKTPAYKGNCFGRVLNIFAFVFKIFLQQKEILSHIKPDAIVASSTHPFDIFPAWFMAKKTRAKLVFEIHDLWPLSLTEIGGMHKYHPFVLAVGLAEFAAYKLPDKVISILPNAYAHAKKFGVSPNNFAVVPNGIELESGREPLPAEHDEEISQLKKAGKFLVGYAGAHGLANALPYLIDAAKLLEDKNAHMVLVGGGQEKENLIQYAAAAGVENISFLNPINKNAIPVFLEQMDALYIGLQKQPLFFYGISPNKLFDYMLAARPIIKAIDAGNDPVKDAACGVSVPAENSGAIADAVLEIMAKPQEERDKMGQNGKEYVLANHDYKVLAKRFLEALR
jgi:glycosyltransferase involved in cell wall biosynthesis